MAIIEKQEIIRTIILAAGKGTRMKTDLVKVLHPLCGKPLLSYVVEVAREIASEEITVVVGYQAETVKEIFKGQNLTFVEQREQLGTGHAVLQARGIFENYRGNILIVSGDVPLLRPSTARSLFDCHRTSLATVTVLTTILPDPAGYGRIVKASTGDFLRIVEERDATDEEKKIKEINTGIYCVESSFLFKALMMINNNNAQKEYYLTDIVAVARQLDCLVGTLVAGDYREVMGINTREELERAHLFMKGMKGGRGSDDAAW
jgi:UDP-N-acetylglucosamine diphosphorylase/glucosamine-1-phosphate N-acetyltransferase